MASIKKKKSGSYEITVSCGRDAQDRKIIRTVTYKPKLLTDKGHPKSDNTIQKEVQAYAAEFEQQIRNGTYKQGNKMTLEEYSKMYLEEHAALTQAPRTLQSTRAAIKIFIKDFGYMNLSDLNPLFLQKYFNGRCTQKKQNGHEGTVSTSTVKRHMNVLSAMLSQAVRWNLITGNPLQNVQLQSKSKPKEDIRYFTPEQAEVFLQAIENPLMYKYKSRKRTNKAGNQYSVEEYQTEHKTQTQLVLFFYLAIFSGCRRGELIALEWSDIDFDRMTININKSTCRADHETITKAPKTRGSIREVTVPSVVINKARQWKAEQARYRLSIGSQWFENDYVFTQWNGAQMGLETPYNAFKRILANYNENRPEGSPELPDIPLHGLRHTSATLLIGQDVDVKTVQNRLGHASASTTLNIYSHALQELDKTASDKLENILIRHA